MHNSEYALDNKTYKILYIRFVYLIIALSVIFILFKVFFSYPHSLSDLVRKGSMLTDKVNN